MLPLSSSHPANVILMPSDGSRRLHLFLPLPSLLSCHQVDGDATPALGGTTPAGMAWDATPKLTAAGATPTPKRTRSRWDETPAGAGAGGVTPSAAVAALTSAGGATPAGGMTPGGMTPGGATPGGMTPGGATPGGFSGATPMGGMDMATPTPGQIALRGSLTPEMYQMMRWEREIEERNKPLSDEELDAMFPLEGYKVLEPPAAYVPIR